RYQLSKQELPPFASCFARKDDWHSFNKPINEDKICNWLNNRARADEFSSLVSKYDDCLTPSQLASAFRGLIRLGRNSDGDSSNRHELIYFLQQPEFARLALLTMCNLR